MNQRVVPERGRDGIQVQLVTIGLVQGTLLSQFQLRVSDARKGKIMHKYPQNQSSVGSSGQTITTNVSMTPYSWQICHQIHVLCGCIKFVLDQSGSLADQTGHGGFPGAVLDPTPAKHFGPLKIGGEGLGPKTPTATTCRDSASRAGSSISNKRHLSRFVPMAGKNQCGHKIRSGCTNPALFGAQEKCHMG